MLREKKYSDKRLINLNDDYRPIIEKLDGWNRNP